jgi:hypothetical protein
MSIHAGILLLLLDGTPSPPAGPGSFRCVDRVDYAFRPTAPRLLLWGRMSLSHVQTLDVYRDGLVLMSDHWDGRGVKECKGNLDVESMKRLTSDLLRTKVCGVKKTKRAEGEPRVGLDLDVGPELRCRLELPVKKWQAEPAAKEFQLVIDRLKRQLCSGPCPVPDTPDPGPDPLDADTVRIVAPPDAAPPPKTPRKP